MNRMIEWMARNGVASNLLMWFILIAGLAGFSSITIKLFPDVDLDRIQIQVVYPGASPNEIEESIVRRIEEKIESVEDIKEVTSTASEGMGSVSVELVRGADAQRTLDEIKSEVDQITTFPVDAEKPQVRQLTNQQQVVKLVVAGNATERELKELANRIKDELTFLPEISMVNISGARAYEISVEVSSDELRSRNLTLTDISAAIGRESMELPSGEIETPYEEMVLRTLGRNYVQKDFEEIVVATGDNGSQVFLGDIATVNDGFADADLYNYYNGVTAVSINVMRVGEEQILDISTAVEEYVVEKLRPILPQGITVEIARDDSEIVADRLSILMENGLVGLVLVVLTLTLFLELRVALWTTLGIVISFVGVFSIMSYLNVSVNQVSSLGFLLAIGIVVDDAIVVGENIFSRYQQGLTPLQAAIQGAQRIAMPVVFAVSTTVAAFAALLTLPGMLGKLLGDIPVIVIGVLALSVLEALFVLPYHLSHVKEKVSRPNFFTKKLDNVHKKIGHGFQSFVDGPLERALRFVVVHPWVTVCSAISLLFFTAGIAAGGYVKFHFFPQIEGDSVSASIELPTGATVERTAIVVARIEQAAIELGEEMRELMEDGAPVIDSINVLVGGQSADRPAPGGDNNSVSAPNVSSISVELTPPENRDFASSVFEARWRAKVGTVAEARKLTFSSNQMSFGDPIRLELSAANDATLDAGVTQIESALRSLSGVFDVRNDRDTGKREITFSLKPEASSYGLSLQQLAFQMRAAFFGDESLRVQRAREDVRVYIRLPQDERNSLEDLKNYRIRTPQGFVPLSQVANLEEGVSPATIQRRNGRRIIAVTANLDTSSVTSNDINAYLVSDVFPVMQQKYPDLTFDFGGEQREQAETGPAMALNFLYALIAIYAMLAIAFKSYIQPLIVMTVIPFGIFGAIMGHLIMGMDLSLLSLFGIVGLSGVIINGALVMIDFINEERRKGMGKMESIIEGAKSRFRPIFLTSLTTFLGVAPLIFETSIQAQFLIPIAISVGFGVLFGTAILLLLVPALMSLYGGDVAQPEMDHSGHLMDDLQEA